ncbi:MAG: hypothetical protein KDE27_21205 [Planctomycetes bacterium]|nr:hypothetical protein [Planctomycetota bacterium]
MSKQKKNDGSKSVASEEATSQSRAGDEFVIGKQQADRLGDRAEGGEAASLFTSIKGERPLLLRRMLSWFFAVDHRGGASLSDVALALGIDDVEAQVCLGILSEAKLLRIEVADVARYRVSLAGRGEALAQLPAIAGDADSNARELADRSRVAPAKLLDDAFERAAGAAWAVVTGDLRPSRRDVQAWLDAVNEQVHSAGDAIGHFGSFESNSRFAARLRLLLQGLGDLHLKDPKTGKPGVLYHVKSPGCPVGRFAFRVAEANGRQRIGKASVALPRLELAEESSA